MPVRLTLLENACPHTVKMSVAQPVLIPAAMTTTTEQRAPDAELINPPTVIQMPLGLLGFELIKQFQLRSYSGEAPFHWLQVPGPDRLAFIVIAGLEWFEDYVPELSEEDTQFLGLKKPEDALVLNIVTLRRPGCATVNLKGPVVIHRDSGMAKQVIPVNAKDLPLDRPLPTFT